MFMGLSPELSAAENTQVLMNRLSLWTDFSVLTQDYKIYINSRKTFAELMEAGRKAYEARDFQAARYSFQTAISLKPTNHTPYYYSGLAAYEEGEYETAEQYYRSALQYGADRALVAYAMGINAAAAGKNPDAIRYLEQAAAASPAQYRTRADALLKRLR
jgi:Flp pilus assembly protein TadD